MRPMTAVERGLAFDLYIEAEVIRNESQLLRLLNKALEYWLSILEPKSRHWIDHAVGSHLGPMLRVSEFDDRVEGIDG